MLTYNTNSQPALERADRGGGNGGETGNGRDVTTSETRVELWRKPIKTGGLDEFAQVEDRLRTLAGYAHVDAVAVKTWARYVGSADDPDDDEGPKATLERLRRFEERRGRQAANAEADDTFSRRPRTARRGRLGPPVDATRVPRAALVEFEDGTVTNVTFADERTGCLTDRLERIAERKRSEGDPDFTRE